jgi:hypothetical protein
VALFERPSNNIQTVLAKANHRFMITDRYNDTIGVASMQTTMPGLQGGVY